MRLVEGVSTGEMQMNQTQVNIPNHRSLAFMGDFLEFESNNNDIVISNELKGYIEEPVVQHAAFNLKKWWFEHKDQFPTLFKFFVKNSSVPATSASSERSFSTSGMIITSRRAKILPSNVNDMILARNVFHK